MLLEEQLKSKNVATSTSAKPREHIVPTAFAVSDISSSYYFFSHMPFPCFFITGQIRQIHNSFNPDRQFKVAEP